MAFAYPIALELQGRRCVVIGGGEVAEHKVRALLEAGGEVTVVAPSLTPGLRRLAGDGRVALAERAYVPGDLEGAFLAIAATDAPDVNGAIFEEAEERRVLLNAVDDVAHCHFAVPSIVRRGDLLLAISTGGKAPALAKRLRGDLSEQFGPEYAEVVDLLGEVREQEIGHRRVDFAVWARRWARAVAHDLAGLVRAGRAGDARALVRRCLAGQEEGLPPAGAPPGPEPGGRVAIVGAGPGDPGLITVRGKQCVDEADVVVHDRLVHPSLYAGKVAIYAGKQPGGHRVPQEETNALLVRLARRGKRVVRLKGGDPFVFGRGAEEAEALAAAGIPFEIVPAPSAAIAAAACAGIPVTDRRHASSVAIVTGHCASGRNVDWRGLAASADTIVIMMGLARLPEIVAGLLQGGRDGATPAALVENGTLPSQRVVTCTLAELPLAARRHGIETPSLVVVGDVVGLRARIAWFAAGGSGGAARSSGGPAVVKGASTPAPEVRGSVASP